MTLSVALCITELERGGAERALVELARRLDRNRFLPVVYCLGPRPTSNRDLLVIELESAGVEVHFLDGRSVLSLGGVHRRLVDLLRQQKPDLLQTFLFHANVLGASAARRAGVPRVVGGLRVAFGHPAWHGRLTRWSARRVDRYVCVSGAVAETAARAGLNRDKLVVIPNGIDADAMAQVTPGGLQSCGVPVGRRVLTCAGRLDFQKGVDWLLQIAPVLLRRMPEHDLLLVGDGPLRPALEKAARRAVFGHRVHFAGWRGDVAQIMAASDLILLPSRWEGMPNVMLEAMALAKPVVATAVEGMAELIGPWEHTSDGPSDDDPGLQLVPPGDSEDFIRQVVSIASQDDLAGRLALGNRARVRDHFSLGATISAYESLYASLCGD